MEHFNKLSPAEDERLALLLEEMGECVSVIGDCLSTERPDERRNCYHNLEKELGDFKYAVLLLTLNKDVDNKLVTRISLDVFEQRSEISREEHRLGLLNKSMGNALQAVGKILRHGYESHHPNGGPDNRELLARELGAVLASLHYLFFSGDLSEDAVTAGLIKKTQKARRYLHHQEKTP